jgi:hypothetical protein
MPAFIEYELDDNGTILIEAPEDLEGVVKATLGEGAIIKSKKKFSEALQNIKHQAKLLMQEIEDLNVSEAEIKFGLVTTGELGNLAIGKLEVGVNYEVTLKWKKPAPEAKKT